MKEGRDLMMLLISSAVCVAVGLDPPRKLGIPNEEKALFALDYLYNPTLLKKAKTVST